MSPVLQALKALTILIQHGALLARNMALTIRDHLPHVRDILCCSLACALLSHPFLPSHFRISHFLPEPRRRLRERKEKGGVGKRRTVGVLRVNPLRIPAKNIHNPPATLMAYGLGGAFFHDPCIDAVVRHQPRLELICTHVDVVLELSASRQLCSLLAY